MIKPTVFGIDFDNTISNDPEGFLALMHLLELRGHICYVVTGRKPNVYPEDLDFLKDKGYRVFFTDWKAKKKYMQDQGIEIDVWIDDKPEAVYEDYNGAGYTCRDVE